jgi:hypothetical protein
MRPVAILMLPHVASATHPLTRHSFHCSPTDGPNNIRSEHLLGTFRLRRRDRQAHDITSLLTVRIVEERDACITLN